MAAADGGGGGGRRRPRSRPSRRWVMLQPASHLTGEPPRRLPGLSSALEPTLANRQRFLFSSLSSTLLFFYPFPYFPYFLLLIILLHFFLSSPFSPSSRGIIAARTLRLKYSRFHFRSRRLSPPPPRDIDLLNLARSCVWFPPNNSTQESYSARCKSAV